MWDRVLLQSTGQRLRFHSGWRRCYLRARLSGVSILSGDSVLGALQRDLGVAALEWTTHRRRRHAGDRATERGERNPAGGPSHPGVDTGASGRRYGLRWLAGESRRWRVSGDMAADRRRAVPTNGPV